MTRYSGKFFFSFAISFVILVHASSQNYSQKDRGLVTYKLGTDTTIVQYFEFDNKKFHTTIFTFTGSVTRYEGDGELDEAGDLKKVFSKSFNLDTSASWKLISEGTNIFNGDSTVYTARQNWKGLHRAIVSKGIVFNVDAVNFYVFPYMGFFAPSKKGRLHCSLPFGTWRMQKAPGNTNREK